MKWSERIFYYDFSINIYQYLHIIDLFKLAKLLENNIPTTLSAIKRDVWICDLRFWRTIS